MSVFRVEKTKGYTVMSNHHLRNHTLSLKAKGLLSQMLSLPEDWDYTLQGLAQINKESIDAIREAVRELERAGYIKRSRERDERGCLRGTVYTIYEQPRTEPTPEEPTQEKPALDNPTLEKPMLDKPTLENPMQLITKGRNKEKQNTDQSITDSIPFPSGFPETPVQKRTEAKESFERYRDLILENIDYNVLASDPHVDRELLDEIAQLVQETVCSTRSRIRVAGNDYPAGVVRSKLLKLNSEHKLIVLNWSKRFHPLKERSNRCNVNGLGFLFQVICVAHIGSIFLDQSLEIRTGIYKCCVCQLTMCNVFCFPIFFDPQN